MKKLDINTLNSYTINSKICCEKHPAADLFIYGYFSTTPGHMKWDGINRHCRGIIVDSEGQIIEQPFTKFWTFRQYLSKDTILLSENQVVKIPKCKYRILEKIDGTMVTLYWLDNKPFLATQRSFTNIKATVATEILYEKYTHTFAYLDKRYTYVFEAVYPETKVLIDYGDTKDLFLIAIICKETRELMPLQDIGFPTCHDYTSEYKHLANFEELISLNLPNKEGFVIHYENGLLVKLKFPWYKEVHKILDTIIDYDKKRYFKRIKFAKLLNKEIKQPSITTTDIWNALRKGDADLQQVKVGIDPIFYMMGFDMWLEESKQRMILAYEELTKNGNTTEDDVWNMVKPDPDQEDQFDIVHRLKSPHTYETIMWNWEKRYL